jgi:hypothetical protein
MLRKIAWLLGFMTAFGACDLTGEGRIPPGKRDGGTDASVPAAQQGLFEYCPATTALWRCWTGCAPGDPYAGWWCDAPATNQVQLMSGDGTCWMIDCSMYQPEVGFRAGGYGMHTQLFPSPPRYQRNAWNVNTVHITKKCWDTTGQQYPTWGWGEIDWGPGSSAFRSFACSDEVSW